VKNLNFAGLFTGVGGVEFGFEQEHFKAVIANEIDRDAETAFNTLRQISNPQASPLKRGDIYDFALDESSHDFLALAQADVLAGGFPCQPFSLAGNKLGFEDPRGNVYWQIERIFRRHAPKVVFLENVKNLMSHNGGDTLRRITASLEGRSFNEGNNAEWLPNVPHYKTSIQVLNALDFGLPQNRQRVFIVGFLDEAQRDTFELEMTQLQSSIVGKPRANIDEFIDFSDDGPRKHHYVKEHPYFEELSRGLFDSGPTNRLVAQWRRVYVRTGRPGVVPTLTANMGTGGHNVPIIKTDNGVIRKMTPRECFSVQGIKIRDETMTALELQLSDSALYKQAGNSVAVPVIAALARAIRSALT